MLDGELMWGKHKLNDSTSDDDVRFQFSVRYSFDANF
jgi:hypothetical protein